MKGLHIMDQRLRIMVIGALTVFATFDVATAGGLLKSQRWFVTGTGNPWTANLVFQSQVDDPENDRYFLSGYFDWKIDGVESGRELFTGTLDADGNVVVSGFNLVCTIGNLGVTVYSATLSPDGDALENGHWYECCLGLSGPIAASWVAVVNPCPDLDGDGLVGVSDLVIVLANWGPCP